MPTKYFMDYYFGDFHFNTEQLTLISNKKTVNLRVNEGKLLALLLSQPQQILSKDYILDTVWAGKVVAEQSIFQNRCLFCYCSYLGNLVLACKYSGKPLR